MTVEKYNCEKCNKKLRLTNFTQCKCGGIYCPKHRYSFEHDCSVDYRKIGQTELKEKIIEIKPIKVNKI